MLQILFVSSGDPALPYERVMSHICSSHSRHVLHLCHATNTVLVPSRLSPSRSHTIECFLNTWPQNLNPKHWIWEHCTTLQHITRHCTTLQHTATRCKTLQRAARHCNTLQDTVTHCKTLQDTATHCTTLQHAATRCNSQQHTATYYFTLELNPMGWLRFVGSLKL